MTPRVQDHPPLPPRTTTGTSGVRRPTQTPKAFAPALAPRRHGGSGGVIGLVALLAALGGAAGWYFFVRQPAVAVPSQADSLAAAAGSVALTDSQSVALKDSLSVAGPAAGGSLAVATPAPVDSTWLDFDRVGDSVGATVREYGDLMRQFGATRIDCTGLSRGLVAVEEIWTDYNVGKKQTPQLDASRATRDQALYESVDDVERHFDRSGCPRP
jgi:hypothetical protein